MRPVKCDRCGTQLLTAALACPSCGSSVENHRLNIVVSDLDPETGDARIRVHDPLGVRSDTHGDTGWVTLNVVGTTGIGRASEARIAESVRRSVSAAGIQAEVVAGADDRGEDRILRVGHKQFELQITTAPSAPDFWREAHVSSATTQVTESHAFTWLRTPIEDKARRLAPGQRGSTVLAIDATHVGVLGDSQFIERYLATFGCPSTEFGFASVWVVGPTPEYCRRLGDGYP